jgi:hypothetical protein
LEATYQTIRSFNSNEAETHSTPERDETRNEQILLANRLSQGNSSLVPELSLRQKIQSSQNIPLVSFESLPNVFKFYKSGELFELSKVGSRHDTGTNKGALNFACIFKHVPKTRSR